MDEQITQLDRRLSSVEKDVATLTAEVEHARTHYATKEDVAELHTAIVASELRLSTQNAALDSKASAQVAALDSRLSAQIVALERTILAMENRHLRWTVGTVVAVAGIVLAIVRASPGGGYG